MSDSEFRATNALRKYINARSVQPGDAPHDLMYYHSATLNAPNIPTFSDWSRSGSSTGCYGGNKPTYHLVFKWNEIESIGYSGVIETALTECFGDPAILDWQLFISGDHLIKLVGEFRAEYVMMLKTGKDMSALDAWVAVLSREINRLCVSFLPSCHPQRTHSIIFELSHSSESSGLALLQVPLSYADVARKAALDGSPVRRTARSPSPSAKLREEPIVSYNVVKHLGKRPTPSTVKAIRVKSEEITVVAQKIVVRAKVEEAASALALEVSRSPPSES